MNGRTFADLIYMAWAHVWNNKQTWLGSIVALLSFIQASDKLRNLMSPDTYEWVMLAVGGLMVLFARTVSGGPISRHIPGEIPKERQS